MKNILLAVMCLFCSVVSSQEVYQLGAVDKVQDYEGNPDGYSIRVSWNKIHPTPTVFNFDWLDAEVDRAKNAKLKVMIRVQTGNNAPQWAIDGTIKDPRGTLPDPRSEVHRQSILAMLRAVCNRYKDDVAYFHVPSFGDGAETNRPKGSDDKSFSPIYVERVVTMAEIVGASRVIVNHGRPQDAWVIEYKAMLRELNLSVVMQMNALSAKTPVTWEGFSEIAAWRPNDKFARGFQMVGWSKADRFGGTLAQAIATGQTAKPFYYEVYRGGDSAAAAEMLEPLEGGIDSAQINRVANLIKNDSYAKTLDDETYQKFIEQVIAQATRN